MDADQLAPTQLQQTTNIVVLATLSASCMHSFTGALGTQLQSSN